MEVLLAAVLQRIWRLKARTPSLKHYSAESTRRSRTLPLKSAISLCNELSSTKPSVLNDPSSGFPGTISELATTKCTVRNDSASTFGSATSIQGWMRKEE